MTSAEAPGEGTRIRLLDAAHTLVYRDGASVGVEALCRAAGVSKRSMYQLFASKDELMAAALERAAPTYLNALMPPSDAPPRKRILGVFEYLEASSAEDWFRGCPFVATAVELKSSDHPASEVARKSEATMTEFFRAQAEEGGAGDPVLLAAQLTMLFDGASSHAVVQAKALDGLAITTATALLDQAGVR